jgi:RNA polymerase sigma-70 factor (ECF subfamily)
MSNPSILKSWRHRWNRNLLRFLGGRVRTAVDVEDLAQETYLRLLRSRDLSEVRNPEAYLIRVAGHVVAEWRHSQPPPSLQTGLDENELADEHLPEFQLDFDLSQLRLSQALATLSPMMRAVLVLRLRDERPYKEIARELGMTERQVKRYLARGYDRLRHLLEA